ncbi:hypothetical protein, partial [Thiolapillus sp.]
SEGWHQSPLIGGKRQVCVLRTQIFTHNCTILHRISHRLFSVFQLNFNDLAFIDGNYFGFTRKELLKKRVIDLSGTYQTVEQ